MTEEYKKNLLSYITGTLENETGENKPYFRPTETKNFNFNQKWKEAGLEGIVSGEYKEISYDDNSNYIWYGNYLKNNKNYGWIAIISPENQVLEILTKYDSGTLFSQFLELEYDEEGLIYGVDKNYENDKIRFIMLNNIAIPKGNTYYVKLRKSYNFVDQDITPRTFSGLKIKKIIGESVYYIFTETKNYPNYPKLITLTINVGSENEWNTYTSSSASDVSNADIVINNTDPVTAIIYHTSTNGAETTKLHINTFNGSTLTTTTKAIPESLNGVDVTVLQNGTLYMTAREDQVPGSFPRYKLFILRNNNLVEIQTDIQSITFDINTKNNYLFFTSMIYDLSIQDYYVFTGMIYNDEVIKIKEFSLYTRFSHKPIIKKTFGLYYILNIDAVYKEYIQGASITIYDNLYNGMPFINYASLKPEKVELYKNDEIIYGRQLYNSVINKNITTSTAEIPNTILNDIPIETQKLLSVNNNILIDNNSVIIKNIYEKLYLNFINTINVFDEDENIYYNNTANYVNQNINTGEETNYENSYLSKYRINYTDNTSEIRTFIYEKISDLIGKIHMGFKVTKEIKSIDFISQDETTIYITKQVDLQVGKSYEITQYVRTLDTINKYNVKYEGQQMKYQDNNIVMKGE